jgi:hypothetical protein
MPYDPTPFGPAQDGSDELPVLIGAGAGEPERLLLVQRPANGRVRVREWRGDAWNTPAAERELSAAELLADVERAERAGRRLNQNVYAVRLWLERAAASP